MAKMTSKGRTAVAGGMGGAGGGTAGAVAGRGNAAPSGKVGGAKSRMSSLNSSGMGAARGGSDVSPTGGIAGTPKQIGKTVTSKGAVPKPAGTLKFDGKGT